MEVLVHGTKKGHQSNLIPKAEASFSLGDVHNGGSNDNTLGKSVYSLSFFKGGCIFSIYTIVIDVLRSDATGYIAFSLFISQNRELTGKGKDVKSILDNLKNCYCNNYIRYNCINRGESELIQEDWTFIEEILKEFKEQDKNYHAPNILTGDILPAFHYYKSDNELIELFDNPFQEEYIDYKQIYFIDYNLKGASNPLNVLKNSGVEVNPDLSNEYLYLNSFSHIQGLTISAYFNNQWNDRTWETGKNIIRSKWPVKLSYQKDEKCYKPIESTEKTATELSEFLEIRGNRIIVKTDRFNKPEEIQKVVEFKVVDHKGNEITSVQILCRSDNYSPKPVVNNKLEFKGRELIESWTAEVISENYIGKEVFTPDLKQEVEIKVKEHKTIPLNVKDEEGTTLPDFEVRTNHTKKFQRTNTLYFINEQIDCPCQIIVRSKGYEDWPEPSFTPAEKDIIDIKLIKKEKKTQGAFLTKLKSIFSNPAGIAISVVFVLLIALGIWLLFDDSGKKNKPQDIPLTTQQIQEQIKVYVDGDSLLLNTLDDYKAKWKLQEPNFITKSSAWRFWKEKKGNSSEWSAVWRPIDESIEKAIKKRILITDKNFEELKNQSYSPAQDSFKTAIEKIDSTQYEDVGQKLGDVSKLTLSEILVKINLLLISKDVEKEVLTEVRSENRNGTEQHNGQKKDQQDVKGNRTAAPPPPNTEDASQNITAEILKYLKGNELNKVKLEEYKKKTSNNTNLKNSIQLGLEFWALDGSSEGRNVKTYFSFREKVKNDANFDGSKLRSFLEKMCQAGTVASYKEIDKKKGLK